MVDTNRPIGWRVIDSNEPVAVVGTYRTHAEAEAICCELEPFVPEGCAPRFTMEPIRSTDMIL